MRETDCYPGALVRLANISSKPSPTGFYTCPNVVDEEVDVDLAEKGVFVVAGMVSYVINPNSEYPWHTYKAAVVSGSGQLCYVTVRYLELVS